MSRKNKRIPEESTAEASESHPTDSVDNDVDSIGVAAGQKPKAKTRIWVVVLGLALLIVAIAFVAPFSINSYAKLNAKNSVAQFKYDEAMSWLTWAEGFGSSDPELFFLKARIFRKTGKPDEFETALAKARALGLPESDMANERLLLGGQSGDLRPLLDGLENIAGGTEQFDPQEVYEAATSGFLMTGRFADAANFIDKWKKDFPDDPNQKFFEAVLLIQIGPIQNIPGAAGKATELLTEVAVEYPNHFRAQMTLGDLLFNQNEIEAALRRFQICESNPDAGVLPMLRSAQCLGRLGKQDLAKEKYAAVLEVESENIDAQAELGKLQFNDEEYEAALKNLEASYSKRKWDFDLANSLARVLQIFDRTKEADELFARSKEIRSKLSEIQDLKVEVEKGGGIEKRIQLGELLLQYGDPKHGLIYIQSALDEDPANPKARSVLQGYLNQTKLANPDLGSVIQDIRQNNSVGSGSSNDNQ
ncbi:hypothetical protein OAE37_01395 [Pirellulaceae bacterium]|nr:hypothetical protein [Pirellulaceae bacterium]